jgi:Ca-activated chloride channel family protein
VTLGLRADRLLLRAGERSRRFVCAEIQAPDAPTRPGRLPVNLAFVLDRSGSMHGDKIKYAREAVLQGIRSLRDQDRFAVVAYDDEIDVVVDQSATEARNTRRASPASRAATPTSRWLAARLQQVSRSSRRRSRHACAPD